MTALLDADGVGVRVSNVGDTDLNLVTYREVFVGRLNERHESFDVGDGLRVTRIAVLGVIDNDGALIPYLDDFGHITILGVNVGVFLIENPPREQATDRIKIIAKCVDFLLESLDFLLLFIEFVLGLLEPRQERFELVFEVLDSFEPFLNTLVKPLDSEILVIEGFWNYHEEREQVFEPIEIGSDTVRVIADI